MAFNIAGQKSLKLNHIPDGQIVTLCDFQTKKPFGTGKLVKWLDGKGNTIPAPAVMANADPNTTIIFEVFHDVVTTDEHGTETVTPNESMLTLYKDIAGAGCFFRNVEPDESKPAKLRRVTVYAAEGLVSEIRAAKQAVAEQAKAEAATTTETVTTEQVTETVPEVEPEQEPAVVEEATTEDKEQPNKDNRNRNRK